MPSPSPTPAPVITESPTTAPTDHPTYPPSVICTWMYFTWEVCEGYPPVTIDLFVSLDANEEPHCPHTKCSLLDIFDIWLNLTFLTFG